MKGKVLVVDDEKSIRRFLQVLLTREGYNAVACSTGKEAVQKIMLEDLDVVLLDILMPGQNGIDTLREIKRLKPNLPVVMVTAVMDPVRGVQAMNEGAVDYVTKPIDRNRLLDLVSIFSFTPQ